MVRPSSTARHSIWWKTGLCVASSASVRKHLPGLTTYSGSGRVSMARICTGEVWVRSTTPDRVAAAGRGHEDACPASPAPGGRAGSSARRSCTTRPRPRAPRRPRSPCRRTRRPAARRPWSPGAGRPAGCRSHGSVTSTASSTSTRRSRSASSSACRSASACRIAARAAPTRLPGLGPRGGRQRADLGVGQGDAARGRRRAPAGPPSARPGRRRRAIAASASSRHALHLVRGQRRHLHRVIGLIRCGHRGSALLRSSKMSSELQRGIRHARHRHVRLRARPPVGPGDRPGSR